MAGRKYSNQTGKRRPFSAGITTANIADHLATTLGSAVGLAYDTATKGSARAGKLLHKRLARSASRAKKRRGE